MLPTLQILWAVIAFSQSTVTENWHLYLLRAITGFLEASSFGGTHLIRMLALLPIYPRSSLITQSEVGSRARNSSSELEYGSWETRSDPCFPDISKRKCRQDIDRPALIRRAAYRNLNGVYGRAGWRWLFIIRISNT